MATTLQAESFAPINLRERTTLGAAAAESATQITVDSSAGYEVGQPIYIGQLAQEGCEAASVDSIIDDTTIGLSAPLKRAHKRYEPVTGVLGNRVRIYRTANVDGTTPLDESFVALASRLIDEDQTSTYYTDSSGSSNYWYKVTYWNDATNVETSLTASVPIRGDDFGHYASLDEIRSQAGFANALRLSDVVVDLQRRMAESEINSALSPYYSVPFKPVPATINALTIQLASAMLKVHAYGNTAPYSTELKDARAALMKYADESTPITDDAGQTLNVNEGVSYDFGTADNQFKIEQVF